METIKDKKSKSESGMARVNDKIVRFNLYLPKEAYEALERLQQLSGKRSLAETVRAALKLYHVVQEGIEEGKEVMLVDKKTKEKEKLVSM
jgi:hypothetical protein